MNALYVAAAAFLGAVVVSLLGWTETTEPFDLRKFASSMIRGIIGAIGIAVAFDYAGSAGPLGYPIAFLAGAGVDAGGKRVAAAIAARLK